MQNDFLNEGESLPPPLVSHVIEKMGTFLNPNNNLTCKKNDQYWISLFNSLSPTKNNNAEKE